MLDHDCSADAESEHRPLPTWASEALACIDALYSLAFYLTASAAAADALVQETFARALDSADDLASARSTRARLYRILRQAAGHRRPLPRLSEAGHELHEPLTGRDVDRIRASCSASALEDALMSLPEEGRMLVLLDDEGLSEAELGYAVGCTAASVRARVSRARAAIWQKLAAQGREPAVMWRA